MQSDLQNWLVLRRIQNAGWGVATETANPGERPQKLDVPGRHLTDCLIDALFGGADLDRVGFAKLIDRRKFIEFRPCCCDPCLIGWQGCADYENQNSAEENQDARGTASNRSEERRVGKECRSRWSP